jgi:hypothetical protein
LQLRIFLRSNLATTAVGQRRGNETTAPETKANVTPMEQQPEQQLRQLDGQPRHHGFPTGVSGHPRGGGKTYKERHDGEVAAMTADFVATHRRQPSHHERGTIDNLARLQLRIRRVRPKRPMTDEDFVKLSNSAARQLRSLGLDHAQTPRKSPLERRLERADRLLGTIAPDGPGAPTAALPHAGGPSDA